MASITVTGLAQMKAAVTGMVAAGKAFAGPIITLRNVEPYARPIETGFFKTGPRAGQVARKAGGAFMYREGIRAVQPRIGLTIVAAIPQGAAGVQAAKKKLNDDAVNEVRSRTPVVSGALQRGVEPLERPS